METKVPTLKRDLVPIEKYGSPANSTDQGPRHSPRIIHTMQSDSGEAIKQQNETSVSIAIAEEKKIARERALAQTTREEEPPVAQKRIGRVFIVVITILTIVVLVAAFVFVAPMLKNTPIPAGPAPIIDNVTVPSIPKAEPLASSLIQAQSENRFDISVSSQAQVFAATATELGKGTPSASVKNLYFTEGAGPAATAISTARFLGFANIRAPEIIVRSFEKNFMLGFYGESNGGAAPFVILKISDYNTGLAGMLEWEAELPSLFDTIFGTHIAPQTAPGSKFSDFVVSGKDARVLELMSGASVAYAFANPQTIIVTTSRTSLEALLVLAAKI